MGLISIFGSNVTPVAGSWVQDPSQGAFFSSLFKAEISAQILTDLGRQARSLSNFNLRLKSSSISLVEIRLRVDVSRVFRVWSGFPRFRARDFRRHMAGFPRFHLNSLRELNRPQTNRSLTRAENAENLISSAGSLF